MISWNEVGSVMAEGVCPECGEAVCANCSDDGWVCDNCVTDRDGSI
jgi:ribosomal protein L37AE/L43A